MNEVRIYSVLPSSRARLPHSSSLPSRSPGTCAVTTGSWHDHLEIQVLGCEEELGLARSEIPGLRGCSSLRLVELEQVERCLGRGVRHRGAHDLHELRHARRELQAI